MQIPEWLNINPLSYLQAAEAGSRMGLANREFADKQQQEDVAADEHQQGLAAEGQQAKSEGQQAKERIAQQALDEARQRQFQQAQLAETSANHQNTLLSSVAENFLNNQRQREASQNLLTGKLAANDLEENKLDTETMLTAARLNAPKTVGRGASIYDPRTGTFTAGPEAPAQPKVAQGKDGFFYTLDPDSGQMVKIGGGGTPGNDPLGGGTGGTDPNDPLGLGLEKLAKPAGGGAAAIDPLTNEAPIDYSAFGP